MTNPARSLSLQGWGLIDLPLRASNEGLLRPRVARAQKIIGLHPLPAPGAKNAPHKLPRPPLRKAGCLLPCSQHPNLPVIFKGGLVDPRLRASNEHIPIVRVPRAGGRPGCPFHRSATARCARTGDQSGYPPLPFL